MIKPDVRIKTKKLRENSYIISKIVRDSLDFKKQVQLKKEQDQMYRRMGFYEKLTLAVEKEEKK
jgi:hypothetical protein